MSDKKGDKTINVEWKSCNGYICLFLEGVDPNVNDPEGEWEKVEHKLLNYERVNPRFLTATGRGWKRRLLELGANEEEAEMLAQRLKEGMAAIIDRDRLEKLNVR